MIAQYAVGLVLSAGTAAGARWLRLLTRDGAVAAIVVGTLVFGGGGWRPAVLLVLFFLTSSLLTRWQTQRKSQPEHSRVGAVMRGRSGMQVLANGLVAAALAVWYDLAPSSEVLVAFAGAVAASTADTWATEIGLLSPTPPRLIATGGVVPPGQSGGVTWLGTAGGVAGAAILALVGSTLLQTPILAVTAAGSAAMVLDSVLGATVEGRRGMTNDTVNLCATTAGALFAYLLDTL